MYTIFTKYSGLLSTDFLLAKRFWKITHSRRFSKRLDSEETLSNEVEVYLVFRMPIRRNVIKLCARNDLQSVPSNLPTYERYYNKAFRVHNVVYAQVYREQNYRPGPKFVFLQKRTFCLNTDTRVYTASSKTYNHRFIILIFHTINMNRILSSYRRNNKYRTFKTKYISNTCCFVYL